MATAIEPRMRVSLGEFLKLPPSTDARIKMDLIEGELVEVTRPRYDHNRLLTRLITVLEPFVAERKLGEVNFDILVILDSNEDPLAPDLVFLSNERLSLLRDGRVWGAPDLVVEVLSPNTTADDYGRKFVAYGRHGVPWLWIIDPDDQRIEEYKHTPEGFLRTQTILRGSVFRPERFPELEIDLARLTPQAK